MSNYYELRMGILFTDELLSKPGHEVLRYETTQFKWVCLLVGRD